MVKYFQQTLDNSEWCSGSLKLRQLDGVRRPSHVDQHVFRLGLALHPAGKPVSRHHGCPAQRPCITRRWTHAVLCLGWLNKC